MTDQAGEELTELELEAQRVLASSYEAHLGFLTLGVASPGIDRRARIEAERLFDQIGETRWREILQPVHDKYGPLIADISAVVGKKRVSTLRDLEPTDPDLWELIALHPWDAVPITLFTHTREGWVPINDEVEARLNALRGLGGSQQVQ